MTERYFSPFLLLGALLVYIGVLLLVGFWAEHRARHGREFTNRGWVYALSLTIYCTSWTYFGSVGAAASSGMLYSAIYLGPVIAMLLSWGMVRRMIRLRHRYQFSSVVDLITQRYGQSVRMGTFITLILLLAMVPYIGLQIRALRVPFSIITGLRHGPDTIWLGHFTDELMLVLIGVLTGLLGLRRVDTRERQHGLLAVLAVESIVKLVAFVAVGVFVTWGLFDGFADLLARLNDNPALRQHFVEAPVTGSTYLTWMNYLVLSMAAVLFLPRMFHVMVIENHDERHLATAMWVFPLYLLLISLFVMPIAIGGLLLGYPLSLADWLVIRLPFDRGGPALALVAYLGGFSASVGMLLVLCTTMAIMFSNHIVLPLIDRGVMGERLRAGLRPIRWAVVFVMLGMAYKFEKGLANSYLLIQMGLVSFVAVLQFVPAGLGGLYWTRGSKTGAWWGLALGWATWAYTLFLPVVLHSSMDNVAWLGSGPWGIEFLRPEALFGLDLGSPYLNTVFWSLLLNITGYIIGSLVGPQTTNETAMATAYANALGSDRDQHGQHGESVGQVPIDYAVVKKQIEGLFSRYLPRDEAALALAVVHNEVVSDDGLSLSGPVYLDLSARVERTLAGAIGAAMARKAVSETLHLSDKESAALQAVWANQLLELRIKPQQLREQVDYFRSLQEISQAHAQAMEEKVVALEQAAKARDHADAARRESEQRFRSLADSAPVMIWMTGGADGEDYFNRAWNTFTGKTESEQAHDGWTDGIHPEDRDDALSLMGMAQERKCNIEEEFRFRRYDGEYRFLRVNILPRFSGDGIFLGMVGSAVDISDLVLAELIQRRSKEDLEVLVGERTQSLERSYADLQDREQTIRTITDSAQDAVIMLDAAGLVSFWNPAAERIFGWSAAEALGRPLDTFLLPERFRAAHRVAYLRFQRGEHGKALGQTIELVALNRSGEEMLVELSLSSTVLNGNINAIGLLRDITERKRSANALRREKAWSEDIIRLAPSMIIGLQPSGEITLFNDYAEQLTGYARHEVIGKRLIDLFIPLALRSEISGIIEAAVQTGDVRRSVEHPIVIRDGSERLVSWHSQLMKEDRELKMILSFGVDVTEGRRAEMELKKSYADLKLLNQRLEEAQNQLLQSEKMASIGQLAAGVAHEINNPVGFVNSNLGTLKKYCEQMLQLISAYRFAEPQIADQGMLLEITALKQTLDIDFLQEDLPALIQESEDGLMRVKKIVQDLKDFSHVNDSEWLLADINAGLDSTLNVVWNEVKYKARVEKHYGQLPAVECLGAQINQVFMNLIVNAVQSLDESKGMGLITLSTAHEDGWIWVEVKDSGRGMPEEVQRRVFEPFFTTKPVGKGTGLGLSLSFNIVQKHGGRIELQSTPGEGTRFKVWVPIRHPRQAQD
jgi:PAS domain S-box-containing protein